MHRRHASLRSRNVQPGRTDRAFRRRQPNDLAVTLRADDPQAQLAFGAALHAA